VRPDAVEVLRGIQRSLLSTVLPELQDPYVQGQVHAMIGLLESLAGEWNTEAQRLLDFSHSLERLLLRAAPVLMCAAHTVQGDEAMTLARAIGKALSHRPASITISALSQRTQELQGIVAELLMLCERVAAHRADAEELLEVRQEAYCLLRDEVVTRTLGGGTRAT